MVKCKEEKSDGLEIISIGKLYTGPWDKKYWSSSRGKVRYPYPIGYNAQRTQNGVTYKMEINEGLNGPLFTISSNDGQSCSGQTPDIAWESFQKKGYQIKLLHGKRFSCKIDGVEFFGFKNTFVQRLLRELVTNISGTPEQNSLSSTSLRDEKSDAVNQTEHTGSKTDPDLPAHSEIPQVTGKRNRKGRRDNIKSAPNGSLKRTRRQKENCNIKALNSGQQEDGEHLPPISADKASCNSTVWLQESESSQTINERENVLVPVVESLDKDSHLKVNSVSSQGGTMHLNLETGIPLEESTESFRNEKKFDRSNALEEKVIKSQMTENKDEEPAVKSETQSIYDANLWAPDSLDHPPDDSFYPNAEIVKDGVAAVTATVPDSLVSDSHPESEMDTSRFEVNSQRSESDSGGKEIANSMMSVLLPQALPLLQTYIRKKKNVMKSPEASVRHSQDKNKTNLKLDSTSVSELDENSLFRQKKENVNFPVQGYVPASTAHSFIESVVPDTFDNTEGGYTPSQGLDHIQQVVEVAKEDQSVQGAQTCRQKTEGPSEYNKAGTERTNDFLPSTQKFVQASGKEINGTNQRRDAIVSGDLTNISPSAEPVMSQVSLSKSIICKDDSVPETCANINAMHTSHFLQGNSSKQGPMEQSIPANESCIDGGAPNYHIKESFTAALLIEQNQKIKFSAHTSEKKENTEDVNMDAQEDLKTESEQSSVLKLIAGYAHPMPVCSVLLSTQGNDIFICVLCGQSLRENRTIFMYKASTSGEEKGCPSFVGHVLISFLSSEGAFGTDIELNSAAVQLTPTGESVVLFNSVKAPSCREGDMKCRCPSCASNLFEENAVKIVQVRKGYVSLITKLKTTERVCCILVCPPDHLVAMEESGKLYIWVMNSKWSAETEECCLLPPDCPPFCSMMLKRIPNSASLVVGYNGFGDFSLWDINKRMLVSKFSATSPAVFQCLPISLFRWQKEFIVPDGVTEEAINEITDATRMSFLEMSDNRPFCSLEDKDVAIWLLVSTPPDPNQPSYQSSTQQSEPHWWRLALLVNNTMIMGNFLDPRATAIGFSAGYGIIGRSDGLVYTWEVATGKKLQNLHHFKGAALSCIATDDPSHRAVAIASQGGQLLVYVRS